ncbi:efflux RND transporter permease subunit [Crenalkalicoccus roseus]|uniref:efflux RND transporter permease subunit n=1 Tax=Crenalkalicoccus roseus TaxID=1485588 RepID=UPI001081718D|nr:efflux RND transporter permease subunit [Crenalkalicoccus roseus]
MNAGLFRLPVVRPVLAAALNLLLIAIGLGAALTLPVREYPAVDPPVVTVRTFYLGASAEVVEREVTRVIEDNLSGISGIRVIRSNSRDEASFITVEFRAGVDIDAAAADLRDRVAGARRNLPAGIEEPVVEKQEADDLPVIFLTLTSERLGTAELTDLAERLMVDQLGTVTGVAGVQVAGGSRYAMRIWLDRRAMAARGITAGEVAARLRAENLELPAGRLETRDQEIALRATTRFASPDEFAALVLREEGEAGRVLLGDVATVEIGAEDYRRGFRLDGREAIALGIIRQSEANALELSAGIRREVEQLRRRLPPDVRVEIGFDEAVFIRETLWNVATTLAQTLAIVVVVIFLFLGSARATLVPAAVIPASVIPAVAVAAALGFSINVLTVLAAILAIGLVVDDAVVILENIRRRQQQEGEPLLVAAVRGTRQVGFAVLATSATLLAVILPLAFLEGNVGRLFREFAVLLGAMVAFSTLAALTLGPMLCSRLFRGAGEGEGRVARATRAAQEWLGARYRAALRPLLARPWAALLGGALFAGLGALAFLAVPDELAPDEDRGAIRVVFEAPDGAAFPYTLEQARRIEEALAPLLGEGRPATQVLTIVGLGNPPQPSRGLMILRLRPWGEREESQAEAIEAARRLLAEVPGVRAFAAAPRQLGQRRGGRALQFVVAGTDRAQVREWAAAVHERARDIPGLVALDTTDRQTRPQIEIRLDRARAAALGVEAAAVGEALSILFGGQEVTRYTERGEEYEVILQARPEDRQSPADLRDVFVRARGGDLVPLSSVVTLTEAGAARQLLRVDRLAAVEISANLIPGVATIGQAVAAMEAAAREVLPPEARIRYLGQALDYVETGAAIYAILLMVLLLTYLVLAGQFESFVHPAIVMTAAPLAIAGGLVSAWLFGLTVNIYSQIGMVLLLGLVAKNGILLVEFANQLRDDGREPPEAAEEAAALRLRPILMTTFSTVLGALPLALATGAGGEARSTIGLIIAGGVLLGTLLTLFVVPALYVLLARHTTAPGAIARELERLEAARRAPAARPAE